MEAIAVTIQILGKEYRVSCAGEERDALIASAKYLDEKMRDIKGRGKIVGTERVAVMAALNIAHELVQQTQIDRERTMVLKSRMQGLKQRIETALVANSPQLQLE